MVQVHILVLVFLGAIIVGLLGLLIMQDKLICAIEQLFVDMSDMEDVGELRQLIREVRDAV